MNTTKHHNVHHTSTTMCITPTPQCALHQHHNVHHASTTMCITPAPQCASDQLHNVHHTSTTMCTTPTPAPHQHRDAYHSLCIPQRIAEGHPRAVTPRMISQRQARPCNLLSVISIDEDRL